MLEESPWDDIPLPTRDFNVRRIAARTVCPCFWGRDASGSCLFILELQGDHAASYRRSSVTVNGIGVDLRVGSQGNQRLVLALEREVDRDLFEGLCSTLVSALEHVKDSAGALAVSLTHINRWKVFLAGRSRHMSSEDVRGLFAELVFLRELIDRGMRSQDAVEAWLGPERSNQDFIFGNKAVEVKSLSGEERNGIRISSEDQLEFLNDELFLYVCRLGRLPQAKNSHSLNELVSDVNARLDRSSAISVFDRKLVAYGYAPLPEYDEPKFVVSDVTVYQVRDDFPRLMRSKLPTGIARVSYDIKLETIEKYRCDESSIFGDR